MWFAAQISVSVKLGNNFMEQQRHKRLVEIAFHKYGRETLARHLNVAARWIDYWRHGLVSLPPRQALAIVDLLERVLRRERQTPR